MATDPPPDLTATQWRDDAWLATFPLTPATALDYFAGSPFYDRACLNEQARARGVRIEQLGSLAGPEYALTAAEPPHLFTIARRWRSGVPGVAPSPQAAYYILAGSIYQAPPLGGILSARLDRCLWTIKAAFARMRADLDPLASAEKAAEKAADGGGGDGEPAQPSARRVPPPRRYNDAERTRIETADRVIGHVLAQHAVEGEKAASKEAGGEPGEEEEGAPAAMAVE